MVVKKRIAVLLAVLLILTTLPGLALGVQVNLDLSWNSTAAGNNITASGSADPNEWVSVKVLDNARSIVFYDAVKSDAGGKYSCTFIVPQVSPGALTVVAGYGTNVAKKSLLISDGGGITLVTLDRIEITKPATKLVYTVGDSLDITGLEVTGYYSDGSSGVEPISAAVISGFDSSKPATQQTLTITIGAKTTTYEVSITKKSEEGSTDNKGGGSGTISAGETVSSGGGTVTEAGAEVASKKAVGTEKEPTKDVIVPVKAVVKDVSGHWAETSINKLVNAGAISGYPDGTFKPDSSITRAEFATVLVKAFNLEPRNGKVFSDTSGHWAENSIRTATAHGIVSGYNASNFGPNDIITREQMAVMIIIAANLTNDEEGKTFADGPQISEWAKKAVGIASSKGIITGYPDNTFKPKANATRAEAVTVIVKAL